MFADPQSVTYNTVAKSLPTIARGDGFSVYRAQFSDATYELRLEASSKKRNRTVARLTRTSVVTDAFVPANSVVASMSATMTIDFPLTGLSVTDAQNLGKALVGFLSDANILKLVGGET